MTGSKFKNYSFWFVPKGKNLKKSQYDWLQLQNLPFGSYQKAKTLKKEKRKTSQKK